MDSFLECLEENKEFIIESVYCFFSSYGFYHFTNNLINYFFIKPLEEVKEPCVFVDSDGDSLSTISSFSYDSESFQEIKKRKRE